METLLNALRVGGIVVLVLLVFNLMILVHEWGHYLAARWRGLKVEKFYIWFGKPLWKKTINGVEYGLGSIPAGGFVALPQMAPMEAIEGRGDGPREELPPITPLDKIIVAFAGPLFSFSLACFFAVLVWQVGKPETEGKVTRTIGWVAEDSPAAKAGLKIGDEILTIDDKPVRRFGGLVDSVQWLVIASEGDAIQFRVKRNGEEMVVPVKAEKPQDEKISWWKSLFTRPQLREVGIAGRETPMAASVQPFSPAEEAGIKANDLIVAVDGIPVTSLFQLSDYIKANPSKTVDLTLGRDGQEVHVKVTPRVPDQRPKDWGDRQLIGIVWDLDGKRSLNHPSPVEQIRDALKTMGETIAAITSRKSDVGASHLSGPIGIFRVYYSLFEDKDGWRLVLWFSVVLNVNLAVMNMLPFPVLDGGHITMAILEWLRRRPLNIRVLEVVQTACVLMLLGFMAFVTLKDAGDWVGGGGGKKKASNPSEEVKFLPPDQRSAAAPAPAPAPAN